MKFFTKKNFALLLALIFTIFLNLSLGYSIRPLYAFSIFLFVVSIASISHTFSSVLIFLLSLISSLYFPFSKIYGPPNINLWAAFFYSSMSESKEFIELLPLKYLIISMLIILIGIITATQCKYIELSRNKKFIMLFLSLTIMLLPEMRNELTIFNNFSRFTLIKFYNDLTNSYSEFKREESSYKRLKLEKDNWNPESYVKNNYNTFIVVIGESARKDYMHTFGFDINNTPYMDHMNGVFFNNYYSASFATVPSLIRSLNLSNTKNVENNNNIIRFAKKAGFYTYWISNQGSNGFEDSPIANIGKEADSVYFSKLGTYQLNGSLPDTSLLTKVNRAIKYTGKKVIFVHLMGSHPSACERTNNIYKEFYISKEVSCYIQSIRQTDKFLGSIVKQANKQKAKWTLLYFSDHGLHLTEGKNNELMMKHSEQFKENYSVPFMITGYDYRNRVFINAKRTAFDFPLIFARWLGFTDKKLLSDCEFFKETSCYKKIEVIGKNLESIDIETLPKEISIVK